MDGWTGTDAVHRENQDILRTLRRVRYDAAASEAMTGGSLDPELAERLAADVAALVSVFTHYKRKERLLVPRLERHGEGDLTKEMWGRDDEVRSYVATAAALMDGARKRPSSGNLQSVAALLEDACEAAGTVVAEEESELLPLLRRTLTDDDWKQVATESRKVVEADVERMSTWAVSPLELAEARLSARGL